MGLVLRGLTWQLAIAFLDDVVVLGRSFEDHAEKLGKVLRKFKEAGMKLKPRKCHLFKTSVVFLGKLVSRNGVGVNPESLGAVKVGPVPKCKKEVESLVGFVNYHRSHIEKLAEITLPLYKLMGAKAVFNWGPDQQEAFELLKVAMTTAPILAYPRQEEPFILDADASNHSIGAELVQIQDGEERVIVVRLKQSRGSTVPPGRSCWLWYYSGTICRGGPSQYEPTTIA